MHSNALFRVKFAALALKKAILLFCFFLFFRILMYYVNKLMREKAGFIEILSKECSKIWINTNNPDPFLIFSFMLALTEPKAFGEKKTGILRSFSDNKYIHIQLYRDESQFF